MTGKSVGTALAVGTVVDGSSVGAGVGAGAGAGAGAGSLGSGDTLETTGSGGVTGPGTDAFFGGRGSGTNSCLLQRGHLPRLPAALSLTRIVEVQ
jgi:hypothetical protein